MLSYQLEGINVGFRAGREYSWIVFPRVLSAREEVCICYIFTSYLAEIFSSQYRVYICADVIVVYWRLNYGSRIFLILPGGGTMSKGGGKEKYSKWIINPCVNFSCRNYNCFVIAYITMWDWYISNKSLFLLWLKRLVKTDPFPRYTSQVFTVAHGR